MTSVLLLLALASRPDTTPRPAPDTVAELLSRDRASHVVLAGDSLGFAFIERGGRRVVRAADSAAAARPRRAARTGWFDAAGLTRQITDGVVRGMRVTFPVGTIDTVRAEGAELTVCFRPNAPDAPRCAEGQRFVFDGTTPADVRRFADAVERARAAR